MVQSLDVGTPQDDAAGTQRGTEAVHDVHDAQAVSPESLQRKRRKFPKVSRKGRRAIGAFIFSVAVAVVVGVYIGFRLSHGYNTSIYSGDLVGDVCGITLYPETCNSTLLGTDTSSPKAYVSKSMEASMTASNETLLNLTRCRDSWPMKTGIQYSTLEMCIDMYQDVIDAMSTSLDTVKWYSLQSEVKEANDLEQLMSAALTYHFTCLDGLQEQGFWTGGDAICGLDTERMTELLSNSLSLLDHLTSSNESTPLINKPSRRRILNAPEERWTSVTKLYAMDDDFPTWLSKKDRRLLHSNDNVTANSVVALDGSGDYTSIQTAINEAPSNSSKRYVIHIKKGTYLEQITVPKDKKKLTILGDGAGETIITGNTSCAVNNVTTKYTATVTVLGNGFIAKDLTIRNTAGPNGHQAVALRVTSQQSAFTWLSLEGYQDTLYAHTNQQFYSYCTIYGTVDYIFGSAAAVFQNCSLLARLPNPGQNITYTASGIASSLVQRYAGLVFHACTVDAAPDLIQNGTANYATFLGRPWHAYARTVFIKSKLGQLVSAEGWSLRNNDASSTSHVVYGEYANFGAGSDHANRVPWSTQLSLPEAQYYAIDAFLKGNLWLPALNISYSGTI